MFGSGILKGLGVTFKHLVDTFTDDVKKIPSRYAGLNGDRQFIDQPWNEEGLFTIQYPEEKRVIPEGFRFIPMLLWDTAKSEDRCTACGICAKVCPPQCIWIVRDKDEKGKPVTRPAEFYIDASICMSCGFCAEFCPFDAIKMNHDYELATFDRYPRLIYDKETLTVPIEYYARLWPAQYQEEERVRAAEEEAKRKQAEERARAAAAKAAAPVAAAEATPSAAVAPTARPKMTPEEIEARKAEVAARRGGEASAEAAVAPTARPKMTPEEIEARKAEVAARRAGEPAPTPAPSIAAPVEQASSIAAPALSPNVTRPRMTPEEIEARKAEVAARRAGEPAPTPAPSIAAPVEQASSIAAPALSPNVTRPRMTPEEIEARKAEVAARRAGEPAPAPVAPTPMAARSDELELIEGIGPKIGAAFRAAGITTFKQLAATPLERMKEILAANSLRADPSTWAEQAALAAAGRLEELKALQDQLIAGRRA
ncbi:MAG: 4Fe-4S binding protein [Anaerolineae bacterium]|uniref:4Fe-4S binding protein n=1 Tax=Candidatus Amarolinea dominans TaxID=3140696 RepID=UPI0031369325|nr:4Fe-4S binding protein [Anaerolineae bacterium]